MKATKYIKVFAAAAALTASLAACQDDVDAPGVDSPVAESTPNITLLELKEMFWDEATNYADSIYDPDDENRRFVIHGRVISSDEQSNVFKSLIIDDGTAAIPFSIDSYNLYLNYRVGQEIVMDVTGMTIGKYAGLQQMGRKSWYANGKSWQVSFMSLERFTDKVQLNGIPQPALIDTLTVNTFSEITATPEGLRHWQSRLVRFKNVYFAEGGEKNFSVYHGSSNEDQNRTIVDRNGGNLTVRTSGYASFAEDRLPAGNVDVVGILSYYNSSWQIILIDRDGVIEVGDVPGSKEKPYEVPQAIADIANGVSAKGWVKGYIVGALAPEVETVGSNGDIEWGAPTVTSSTLVVAPDPDCKEISRCLLVALPSESVFQKLGNLRDNPANLGKEILVYGNLGTYMGTYGITGNSGKADEFEIDGVNAGGETEQGDGSEEKPFNVAQVVAMNPQSTTVAVEGGTGVWVTGYIVGFMPTGGSSTTLSGTVFGTEGAANTNLVIGPTADCTNYSQCVGIQVPAAMRAALSLDKNPGNLGKLLSVKGDIMKYCGGPGVKNLTANKLDGNGGGGDTPTPPAGDPKGDGTEANPYNAVAALAAASALADGQTQAAYVKGKVMSIDDLDTGNFGNATYNIGDVEGGTTFLIYRGYYLGGAKFTSKDQLKVGDEVVVQGDLINFMGNTPEMAQRNKIISINGSTTPSTPDTPDTPDVPDTPAVPGDVITLPLSTFTSLADGAPVTAQGITFTAAQNGGTTPPQVLLRRHAPLCRQHPHR